MSQILQYIRTNNVALEIELSNYVYQTADRVIMVYKRESAPVSQWGLFISTRGERPNTANLLVQDNLYGGRRCMNFNHAGVWSGDGAYTYDSPQDTINYYKIDVDGSNIGLYKGADLQSITNRVINETLGTTSTANTLPLVVTPAASSGSVLDISIFSIRIWRDGNLIHDYVPIHAGFHDNVDNTEYVTTHTGYIDGPVAAGVYTIVYNANGGTGTMPDQSVYEGELTALAACTFTRDRHTFSGWGISPSGPVVFDDQEVVIDITAPDTSITLYAIWSRIPFSITLLYNKTENNALTKDTETVLTLTGTLREDCSIIDPVILITADLSDIANANYLYIADFRRYYYILDVVSVQKHFVEITAHCDVLASFAAAIRAQRGIVHRQEKEWNLLLNDGSLQVYQDPLIDTIAFPGSFSGQSYVMLVGGNRGGGIVIGSGDGNTGAKTTSGLLAYAQARLGSGYWYGCYGQTADAALFNTMSTIYYAQYTAVDYSDHADQYGQRVQDCVGLIKGYRWSDSIAAEPVYNQSEDVNVAGLYASCNERHTIASQTPIIGSVLFNLTLTHCGVYAGNGKVIEARSHAYGVVETNITDAGRTWTWWGVPSWLTVSTAAG